MARDMVEQMRFGRDYSQDVVDGLLQLIAKPNRYVTIFRIASGEAVLRVYSGSSLEGGLRECRGYAIADVVLQALEDLETIA